ncbi:MAG: ATP-binding protein [Clostridia bacterium]|jgi:anti-sigma regulatory factor (Ser/Thr protein kinase)|nr:ATP-binding protein [Clostridia bacterium]
MADVFKLRYDVDGDNFMAAGAASSDVKKVLRQLGIDAEAIRKAAVAMYEGEINMVIHAGGGVADITVADDYIEIILSDKGPGIPDVEKAMQEGWSTAPDNIRALGFGAGMGLPNMKKYSDEMKIDTVVGEGTTITMKIYI